MKNIFATIFLTFIFNHIFAQKVDSLLHSTVQEIMDKGVQDFSENEISLAGKFSQSQEQAPSVVSVINQEDIKNWGCRDIADVLRLIPGFEFGVDVLSLYGLGFRGIWAHEGKALVMINGTAINCMGFGNTNFFGTYPVNMLERVEIIRGPGSALYGGFAEVAAINMITKKGKNINGVNINTSAGIMGKDLAYQGNLGAGFSKHNFDISGNISYSFSPMSQQNYTDFDLNTYPMNAKNSWRKYTHLDLKGSFKKLAFVYQKNLMQWIAPDQYGYIESYGKNRDNNFGTKMYNFNENLHLTYDFDVSKQISIKPLLAMEKGNPITTSILPIQFIQNGSVNYINSADFWQNSSVQTVRYRAEITASFENKQAGKLLLGTGYQQENLEGSLLNGMPALQTSARLADTVYNAQNNVYFGFFQYNQQIKNFGITVGTRYENTLFGDAFAPRIGLTYVKEKLNMKLLYGRAFRVPLLWQAFSRQFAFVRGQSLIPEIADTYESEIGYKFTPKLSAKLNIFYININEPITYIGKDNSYQNFGRIVSQGIEGEILYKNKNVGGFFNFSYAKSGSGTSKDFITDQGNFLAMPTVKMNFGFYFKYKKLTVSPTTTWLSERYGQSELEPADSQFYQSYPALMLANVNFLYQNLFKHLDLNFSVYNIGNTPYKAIQPYYGGHALMPVGDRQISVGLNYQFR